MILNWSFFVYTCRQKGMREINFNVRCCIVAAGIGSYSSAIPSSQNRGSSLFQADGRRVVLRRPTFAALRGISFTRSKHGLKRKKNTTRASHCHGSVVIPCLLVSKMAMASWLSVLVMAPTRLAAWSAVLVETNSKCGNSERVSLISAWFKRLGLKLSGLLISPMLTYLLKETPRENETSVWMLFVSCDERRLLNILERGEDIGKLLRRWSGGGPGMAADTAATAPNVVWQATSIEMIEAALLGLRHTQVSMLLCPIYWGRVVAVGNQFHRHPTVLTARSRRH